MQATALLEHEFFPWSGLPYPYEHAQLGVELVKKGELEAAQKLVAFQQAALDHHHRPLYPLFRQEKGRAFSELEEANRQFFEAFRLEPATEYRFEDPELGYLYQRDREKTVALLGSGCKSGMGTFLVEDAGVLTYGPQLTPIGDCSGFGLAGRGTSIELHASTLRSHCRLAAPHPRDTGYPWLEDSGYAGMWLQSTSTYQENQLHIEGTFEGFRPLSEVIFALYLKADACFVATSHKLHTRSLDRYEGPPQPVEIEGMVIHPQEGFSSMHVIPLAGDRSFWGADFLLALSMQSSNFKLSINRLTSN